MKFSDLISLTCPNNYCIGNTDIEIGHICSDSRAARSNSVFVCISGSVTDGHLFARSAYNLGCRAFVAEQKLDLPSDAAVMYAVNTRKILASLSAGLYANPSQRLKVIGITGTKGKTTTALMIAGILNSCGIPAGYIGSNGVEYGNFKHRTSNTTPESCDLQRYLYEMASYGIRYVALEVSSQALYLDRIRCIDFDTCVFTNLSPDHIGGSEHPDFSHYKACKASLFTKYKLDRAIINADDINSYDMVAGCKAPVDTFGFNTDANHRAGNISQFRTSGALGVSFDYINGSYCRRTQLNLPGEINVSNALAAIAVCRNYIPDTDRIIDTLPQIKVEGRFELVNALPYATIVIDYAHNGTSFSAVLHTLRSYKPKRLICLFGSVGGRTQMRRPELGAIASSLCDLCILTADNPDCEDPALIIRDIASAFVPGGCDYISIPDRREAIKYAVGILREGDILLLAGKGHENYQLIRGIKTPFCEKDIVLEAADAVLKSTV